MDFSFNQDQEAIVEAVTRLCADFGDAYWLKHDREGGFPHEFHRAMAAGGWLGIAMPEAYGGAGKGILEAALVMNAVAASGAGSVICNSAIFWVARSSSAVSLLILSVVAAKAVLSVSASWLLCCSFAISLAATANSILSFSTSVRAALRSASLLSAPSSCWVLSCSTLISLFFWVSCA